MIDHTDILAQALRSNDLDTTVGEIMHSLGIKTGDVAAQCFSGVHDEPRYRDLPTPAARAEFIKSWLSAELDDAAARVAADDHRRGTDR